MFDWANFLDYAIKQDVKKNNVVFQQGNQMNGFYYVATGQIGISVLREDGFERLIDIVYPGSLIGEQMINETPSFTTATAWEHSILYFFSKDQFTKLTNEYPEVTLRFSHSLINKVRYLAKANTILNAPADVQLADFLLMIANRKQSDMVKMSQNAIAKYIGKSRVTVWKILKQWEEEQIIELTKQYIRIIDLHRLQQKETIA